MIKVSVLYPFEEGYRFDMTYYVDKHVAMIREVLGTALLRAEIDKGIGGAVPQEKPPFVAAVHMYFESVQTFQESFGPHGSAIRKDVPNYTSIRPLIQMSTVFATY